MSQSETQAQDSTEPFSAIIETDTLSDFIATQTTLVDEARWRLEEDGITIRAVDPANVGMVKATLELEAFESYQADGRQVGLNLNRLDDYITSKIAGDLVQLSIDEETRKLTVDVGPTEYTMALIDPDSIRKEPDLPDLKLPGSVVIEGELFANAISATDLVSEHARLTVDDEAFTVSGQGDTDDATTVFKHADLLDLQSGDREVASLFSLDYVKKIVSPIPDGAEVSLEVGEEFPFRLEYAAAEGQVEVLNLLSPRIRSD